MGFRLGTFNGLVARLANSGPFFELLASITGNDSASAGRNVAEALDILSGVGGPSIETDWYVDSVNGDNSNDGLTAVTALKTMNYLSSVIGVAKLLPASGNEVRVHILNNVAADDAFSFSGVIRGNALLRIIGEAATQLLVPTALTGVVGFVLGTTRPTITIAGVDWAAQGLVGKRCRVISGATAAAGTLFWVESVGGAPSIANISRPYLFSATGSPVGVAQSLSVGDVIVVEELTQSGPLSLNWQTDGTVRAVNQQVTIENLRTHTASLAELNISIAANKTGAGQKCMLFGCENVTTFCTYRAVVSNACRYFNPLGTQFIEGGGEFRACSFASSQIQFIGSSTFTLAQDCSAQASKLICGVGQTFMQAPMITVTNGFSLWGWSGDGLVVRYGARLLATAVIWGVSAVANSFGVRVSSGGELQYSTKPTVVGALAGVKDARIGGVDVAWAVVPLPPNAANLARIVVVAE